MNQTPAFLTTREVADLLRVKERKVYDLAAEGNIPCRRITGKLLFPKAELDAWLGGGGSASPALPAVVAGSHDPLLDWAIRESGSGLATFFDGSLNGLEQLTRGQALAAGLHVFEPEHDDWNKAHAGAVLAGKPFVMVEWVKRQQGLLLSPGSSIETLDDLRGKQIVRRQPSAGAGLLLDHLLDTAGLTDAVIWRSDTARTETDAAMAIASGEADAAPGLAALATQFGLGFIPTKQERFDLIVDRKSWFEAPIQALMEFTRSEAFLTKASSLKGYDIATLGTVHWNG